MRVYLQNPPTVRIGGQITKSLYQFSLQSSDKNQLYLTAAKLEKLMIYEGRKLYHAPHDIPTQLFAYTALQEKATQLYYTCIRQARVTPLIMKCW